VDNSKSPLIRTFLSVPRILSINKADKIVDGYLLDKSKFPHQTKLKPKYSSPKFPRNEESKLFSRNTVRQFGIWTHNWIQSVKVVVIISISASTMLADWKE
jgi:hypothetical protein